ncbi:2-hydroxyacid dehydrogenase [Pararhizobium sp.]|uniref:2-hydroxyacid dehydrogenase n=1 Tax=Pararhizobium sp. TaxID=1977563 RepID=UPI00271CE20E|nr:glyoxylate/hydroxypyruvate reductase A [Pararhizobium sp.]MDO9418157.1 glyoxylate/hydroxypyruvate reductase A [Pararhizobium sp.]
MTRLVALVTRTDTAGEKGWLDALRREMPGETIVAFRDLKQTELASVEIAIVANPDPADLARMPNLTWIHSLWAGVERLVLELKDMPQPIVRLVDPQMAHTMSEAVLAWTYYLFRDMPAYARQQKDKIWEEQPYRRADRTQIGLLGLGALGLAAAARLQGAGFNVMGWSRSAKVLPGIETFSGSGGLSEMLRKTDILVCLIPLTAETRGLVDAETLKALPAGASLINFARGPVVVADDLVAALDSSHLKHAVLDVFEVEPLPVQSVLWDHPQITVLPHISAPTDRETAAKIVAGNIAGYRSSGTIPAQVDRTRGY